MVDQLADVQTELVHRIASGDEAAVAELFDMYASALFAFGRRRLGSDDLAELLVQETMTRVWRHAGKFARARGSVRTWIFVIARSVAADIYRRHERHHARRADIELTRGTEAHAAQLDHELEQLLSRELVRAAFDRLSPEHREILQLAHLQGFSQQLIADRLGIALGTVKSRTYYAMRAFALACDELGVER